MDAQPKTVHPIGFVRNGVDGSAPNDWSSQESDLVIDRRWTQALDGVEKLERLIVIWWFDRREGQEVPVKVHPRRDPSRPLTGLFATRAPIRPNLIGVTIVEVLGRKGNVVRVRGPGTRVRVSLDGTPILDLKPA